MTDALTSGQQAIGKLQRLHVFVASDIFEPFHAVARRILQFERFDAALGLVRFQSGRHIPRMADMLHERYGVFHGQLRSGADRKMRRGRGIADEHARAVVPVPANYSIEIEPWRPSQMARIRQQRRVAQVGGKQLFAKGDGLIDVGLIEAVGRPSLFTRLDNDRREILAELVSMDLKPAMLGLLKGEGERRELLRSAEPDVTALANFDIRAEFLRLAQARLAVGSL